MPPTLALFLTVVFMVFLFRRDFRERPNVTGALWLPILWTMIIASRPVSQWLNIFGFPGFGGASLEEGSPLDACVYIALIAAGLYVLAKRQVRLSEIFRDNGWLIAYLLFCLVAIVWADYPTVAFKRWTKILGHPIMVLILFTEPDPDEALTRLMKRCAYVILPVSILLIKYYPAIGRKSVDWGGESTNIGIAGTKNLLGADLFVLGIFFFWHLLQTWRRERSRSKRQELWLTAGMSFLVGYSLRKAHSSTSTIALLLGVLIIIALGLRSVNKRYIAAYAVAGVLLIVAAQLTFDVYGSIVELSGHESTIEGRGRLWQTLLETDRDPILGVGFESYWLGERLEKLWAMPEFQWRPTEAHNGYVEIYLTLGIVGLLILIGLILATFRKCQFELLNNFEWGRFRMGSLVAIVAYNWTEAAFKALHVVFLFFFIIAINYPKRRISPMGRMVKTTTSREETDLVHSGSPEGQTRGVEK